MDRTRWVMMPRSDRRTLFDPATTTGLDLDHWDPVDECLVDRRSTLSQALHIGSRRGNHLWFTTENGRSFQARRILRQVAGSSGRHRADVRHCPQVAGRVSSLRDRGADFARARSPAKVSCRAAARTHGRGHEPSFASDCSRAIRSRLRSPLRDSSRVPRPTVASTRSAPCRGFDPGV